MLQALLLFENYETTNYDVSGMRRYRRIIFQWKKNDMKSTKMTNGDYYKFQSNNFGLPVVVALW